MATLSNVLLLDTHILNLIKFYEKKYKKDFNENAINKIFEILKEVKNNDELSKLKFIQILGLYKESVEFAMEEKALNIFKIEDINDLEMVLNFHIEKYLLQQVEKLLEKKSYRDNIKNAHTNIHNFNDLLEKLENGDLDDNDLLNIETNEPLIKKPDLEELLQKKNEIEKIKNELADSFERIYNLYKYKEKFTNNKAIDILLPKLKRIISLAVGQGSDEGARPIVPGRP